MLSNQLAAGALTNPRVLAVMRIVVGCAAFTKGTLMFFDGVAPWFALTWLVVSLVLVLGFRPRLAATALVMLGLGLLFGGFYKNHAYLLVLVISFVAMMASGRHYSVRPRDQGPAPAWPLALMSVQVSIVYGFAGIAKLNPEFFSGDVLGHYFERALLTMTLPAAMLVTLAFVTVGLELFVAASVWLPRARPVAFGLAIPLHVGMLFVSSYVVQLVEIVLFAILMFVLLTAFLHLPERGRVVVWDDSCSFCRRWVAFFRRADAFGALRFVGASDEAAYLGSGVTPGAALQAMHLVEPDGAVRSGFDAVRGIVAVLPGGFLVAPWMAIPGVRHLGSRAYRRVAGRRTCAYIPATMPPR